MRALGTLMNQHELAITSMHQIGGGCGPGFDSRLKEPRWRALSDYNCIEPLRNSGPFAVQAAIFRRLPILSTAKNLSLNFFVRWLPSEKKDSSVSFDTSGKIDGNDTPKSKIISQPLVNQWSHTRTMEVRRNWPIFPEIAWTSAKPAGWCWGVRTEPFNQRLI